MDSESVLEIVALLADANIHVCLDGGWGVDALLGEQTREHGDLDLIVCAGEVATLRERLAAAGFRDKPGGTAAGFVLADALGREVDVHAVEFDARGYGSFILPDGRRWPFPPAAFAARGRIGAREVCCLSPDAQVQCHAQGYPPTENDLRDMERLQERFGVVLPLALCRDATRLY